MKGRSKQRPFKYAEDHLPDAASGLVFYFRRRKLAVHVLLPSLRRRGLRVTNSHRWQGPQKEVGLIEVAGNEESVLAIDPGSAKCGLAIVTQTGVVKHRAIVPTASLVAEVQSAVHLWNPIALIVGKGTGSKPLLRHLQDAQLALPVQSVDESYTSELARVRYVAENPPRGWQRLLPRSLRTPPCAYDDYVAILLAERWWNHQPSDER